MENQIEALLSREEEQTRFRTIRANVFAALEEIRADLIVLSEEATGSGASSIGIFEYADGENKRALPALVTRFFRFVEEGDLIGAAAMIDAGIPAGVQDRNTGETALHVAAACNAREMVKYLIGLPNCDYVKRDKRGNRPSDSAYLYGRNPALARLLAIKERKQAKA